ncbi:hypothetical protein GCM10010344_78470 [Streptomyces bluensis]|nr:hypothetical protein GCM10010344_78470 [Streptomyces bluensis]
MRPLSLTGSPAAGALRGMRAGVLLPPAGHVLSQGHSPRWPVVAMMAGVAVPGTAVLTHRRLTGAQLPGVLVVTVLLAAARTESAIRPSRSGGSCGTG